MGERVRRGLMVAAVAGGLLAPVNGLPTNPALGQDPSTIAFAAEADTWVELDAPDVNHGSDDRLRIDSSPMREGYVRFAVTGAGTAPLSATLRLFASNGSANGPAVFTADSTWNEGDLTWNTRPALTSGIVANTDRVTAGQWTEYDVTSIVAGDGTYTFALISESNDGVFFQTKENAAVEKPELVLEFGTDVVPPETTIDSGPSDPSSVSTADFTFSSSEAGSTFMCSLDAAGYVPCTSPTSYTGLSDGPHTFDVVATDGAGNTDPSPASWAWTIDTSVPVFATFDVVNDATVDANSPTTNFGLDDELKVDGSPLKEAFLSFDVTGISTAPIDAKLRIYVTNSSNNGPAVYTTDTGWTETSITWNNRPTRTSGIIANVASTPSGTWIDYDVTSVVTGNGNYSFNLAPESGNGAFFRSKDTPQPETPELVLEFGADVVEPDTTIQSGPPDPSSSPDATFVFSAFENATYECSLDAASFSTCTSPTTYNGLAEAAHTFQVRATDLAGNVESTPATWSWTIDTSDTTPPETTIVSAPTDPSPDPDATFAFTASEPGSTFECALDGAGFSACTSPASYSSLADGIHTFQVRATDAAGNTDPSPAVWSWTIDTGAAPDATPPQTAIDSGPDQLTSATSASFTFSGHDGGQPVQGVNPFRDPNCDARVAAYINGDHSSISQATLNFRINWMQTQCDRNHAADLIAQDQGWISPEQFPPGSQDRDGMPLDCMDISDANWSRHDNDPAGNPSLDPNWPGGVAPLNVPGDFMVVVIGGQAHFMMRVVVWNIEDSNGGVLNPMLIKQESEYPGSLNETVASVNFANAYEPTSVWVEIQDEAALAEVRDDRVLTGRETRQRTWFAKSACHDKRGRTVIPQILLDHAQSLGWLQGSATTTDAHYLTVDHAGDPLEAENWFVSDVVVPAPTNVNFTLGHPWFLGEHLGSGSLPLTYECSLDGAGFAPCSGTVNHSGLSLGVHTFDVRATDAEGNTDASPARFTWTIADDVVYGADEDSFVDATDPDANFGSETRLKIDSAPEREGLIKFTVGGVTTTPIGAKLRLFVNNSSSDGPELFQADNAWSESTVTWNTKPTIVTGPIGDVGDSPSGTWVEYDVSSVVTGQGTYSFALRPESANGVWFYAKDATVTEKPELVVFFADDSLPPETSIDVGPPDPSSDPNATFSFSSSEPNSTFACSLDGGPVVTCSSPVSYIGLGTGSHTFEVAATDPAGNADPTPATWSWTVSTAVAFGAEADSYVQESSPTSNHGTSTKLKVDASPLQETYLRFSVSGLTGPPLSATLRVYATNGSGNGPEVYEATNGWSESTVTWNDRPTLVGAPIVDLGRVHSGQWTEIDVTAVVGADGLYTFAFIPGSADGAFFNSKENGAAEKPELVIVTSGPAPLITNPQ